MKKITAIIFSFVWAVIMFTSTAPSAYAEEPTTASAEDLDPDFFLRKGEKVSPLLDDSYSELWFEVIEVEASGEDVIYSLRLLGCDYNIVVTISDSELWEIGFSRPDYIFD